MSWDSLDFSRPLVIAEIGGNHEGSIERAYALAELAAANGADAVKFQTYWADTLVNPRLSPDRHAHFRRFELSRETWLELAGHVRSLGVEWMTSLWDESCVDLLAPYVPAWKVGSGDLTNVRLLDRFLATGKPLIASTAMSSLDDVDRLVEFVRDRAPELLEERRFALLQCTAMYDEPASAEVDLDVMATYRERYGVVVGYSDHDLGLHAAMAAAALGAQILEVHVTDDKTREFRDHKLSLDAAELRQLRTFADAVPTLKGSRQKRVTAQEAANRGAFRRGLYPTRALRSGHVLAPDDLAALRPCTGIGAEQYFELVGRRLARDVDELAPLSDGDVEPG